MKMAYPQRTAKPTLAQFKYPLFNTLLIASGTCLCLHSVWTLLELEHVKRVRLARTALLEDRIQQLLDDKKLMLERENRSWFSKFLWK